MITNTAETDDVVDDIAVEIHTKRNEPRLDLSRLTIAKPFLKWAGGKTWLLPTLQVLRPKTFNNYHEPFLGGGSHFFDLRSQGFRGISYLCDLNAELICTYSAVKRFSNLVLHRLDNHVACHSEPYFEELRSQDIYELKPDDLASRMIYLNKAGFNGLYRVNKKGQCNIPWGKKDSIAIDEFNIHKVSTALQNTFIIQGDFGNILNNAKDGDFAFIDPPYPNGFTKYTPVGFDETDQNRLHEVCVELANRNVSFIQTNADCPFIRNLYRDFEIIPVMSPRRINCKGKGRGKVGEVLIMNY